jgi:choice-of-anchor C domain-containing protein
MKAMQIRATPFRILFAASVVALLVWRAPSADAQGDICSPPASGIRGWWPLQGGAGDIIGTNAGVISGLATFATGQVGDGMVFDGVNNNVRVPAEVSLNVGAGPGLTLELWAKPTDAGTLQPLLEWNNNGAIGTYLWIAASGNGALDANLIDANGVEHPMNAPLNTVVSGAWQHFALTYDRTNGIAKLYRNGVMVLQRELGSFTPQTSWDLFFGSRGSYRFKGIMDEVSLYSRALTAAEIESIFTAGAAGKCVSASAPSIIVQPSDVTVKPGGTATFSVQALGALPLEYEWRHGLEPVLYATNSTLVLTDVQVSQAGDYSVVIRNPVGVVTSAVVRLTIAPPSFDVGADFSSVTNPSPLWSYGWKPTVAGPFTPLDHRFQALANNGVPMDGWNVLPLDFPAVYHNSTTNTALTTGGVYPPGTTWFHPGFENTPKNFGVIRLVLPPGSDGIYRLDSAVEAFLDNGDSGDCDYHVVHNGIELFAQFLPPRSGTNFGTTLSLRQGDTVDFLIGRGADGRLYGSGLKLNATLTFVQTNEPPPPPPPTFVVNGSFENGIDPGVSQTLSAPDPNTIQGWVVEDGTIDYIGTRWLAADGSRCLDMAGVSAGTISQTVQGLEVGKHYELAFSMAGNPELLGQLGVIKRLRASIDGVTQEFAFDATGASPTDLGWTTKTLRFIASASSVPLSFISLNGGLGGAALDNVSIHEVSSLAPSFDVESDFSENANPGSLWSYGWKSEIGGAFTLLTHRFGVTANNGVPLTGWSYAPSDYPAVYHNGTTNRALAGGGVYEPKETWFHPGFEGTPRNFGAIRLTLPAGAGGIYRLESSVAAHLDTADSGDCDYHVVQNGVELFGQSLPPRTGTSFATTLLVNAGDTLDFLIGRGADGRLYGSGLKLKATLTFVQTNVSVPPTIIEQPANLEVTEGAKATFTVRALGTAPLSYQWRVGETPIPDSTDTSLVLTNVKVSQAGEYSVTVSNAFGVALSSNANLLVLPAPPPPTWDLSRDFSITANPNQVWSYGYKTAIDGTFGLNLVRQTGFQGNGVPLEVWAYQFNALPSVFFNATDKDAINGSNIYPPGTVFFFAGFDNAEQNFGAIRLTVPEGGDGIYLLESSVRTYLNASEAGDTDYHVVRNGEELFGEFMAGGARSGYTNRLALSSGDEVDFLVGRGQDGHLSASGLILEARFRFVSGASNAPTIIIQPKGVIAMAGDTVTLSVRAAGSQPIQYQWIKEGEALLSATNSSLLLANLSLNDAGNYWAVVANNYGAVTSSVALVQVTRPPSVIKVPSIDGPSGSPLHIPIEISANGLENAVGLSLEFDPTIWEYSGAALPEDGPAGASLLVNANQIATGRLGLAFALPSGATLAWRTQQLAVVTLESRPSNLSRTTTINFGDTPTLRQVASALAAPLPAQYSSGTITLLPAEFEADAAPRPGGDGIVSIIDWVQVGRFAAGLDSVSSNEFRRVDCAPRANRGNGNITVADWVQAGRYAAGLDPLSASGGPSSPGDTGGGGGGNLLVDGRRLTMPSLSAVPGSQVIVPVVLELGGNENALGFSLSFDASKLSFIGATLNSRLSQASLNVNSNLAASGKVGFAMAMPVGMILPNDIGEILRVGFASRPEASGIVPLIMVDSPVYREVVSADAASLPCVYSPGSIAFLENPSGPRLAVRRSAASLIIAWPSAATNFELYSSIKIRGSTWSRVPVEPIELEGQKVVILPVDNSERWFRLMKP